MLWTTPWGEKIRFFAKTKDKEALDLYKDAMKGPKPYFSPYSEWEADGKEGNWIFYGKRTLEGWKLAYRDAKLIAITAPSGRKIEFGYYDGRPTAVTQDGKAFLELSYDGNLVKELKINGVAHRLAYASGKLLVLPETVNGKMILQLQSKTPVKTQQSNGTHVWMLLAVGPVLHGIFWHMK